MSLTRYYPHIYNYVQYIFNPYMAYMDPSPRHSYIYDSVHCIYDTYTHPCSGTVLIYTILYDIYLVYIYRIYKSRFVTALIYMIQYDIYLAYI